VGGQKELPPKFCSQGAKDVNIISPYLNKLLKKTGMTGALKQIKYVHD
jgi:hypothetical protein